ncbi:MAG: hypothetical protein FD127_549, partial [Acidimicrobiaceae bacterium]
DVAPGDLVHFKIWADDFSAAETDSAQIVK